MPCNPSSMPTRKLALASLLLALASTCTGLHAEIQYRTLEGGQRWSAPKKYSAHAQSAGGAAQEVRVSITGVITAKDAEDARAMEALVKGGRQKLSGNTVWLASEGGDLDASLEIGRVLRRMGAFTVVGKSDQCASACVFAFMGGERRAVAGQLGIHRPYFPFTQDTPDRQARFRHLQKTVRGYIEEMDFPSSFYETMMLVPPETMKFLDPAELKRFYLQGISPSSEDLADAAAARRLNLTMMAYLQKKAKAPACVFPVPGEHRCAIVERDLAAMGNALDDSKVAHQGDGNSTGAVAQ